LEKVNVLNHKNFCPLPWMHLYKDTDHSVKLCCADRGDALGDLSKDTLSDIRNNDGFKEIRKQFLNDERPERCLDCWRLEDRGRSSLRSSMVDAYIEHNHEFSVETTQGIGYLDYRTSNLCNLGCKICIPHYSSKLAEINVKENLFQYDTNNPYFRLKPTEYTSLHKTRLKVKDFDEILTDDLYRIYFAGGEPMLSEDHWKMITELKNTGRDKNVSIMYNTNGTLLHYKGQYLLDLLDNFKEVTFSLSLDGIGKSFEYWRTGGKWDKIKENLDRLKDARDKGKANIIIGVTSAVGWINFKEVFKLHRYLVENDYILNNEQSGLAIQMQPVYDVGISFEKCPIELKDEINSALNDYQQWIDTTFTKAKIVDSISVFRSLLDKAEPNNEGNLKAWLQHNKVIDKHFGTKWEDIYTFDLPRYNEYLDYLHSLGDKDKSLMFEHFLDNRI